jgi:hypothetical protein
LITIGFIKPIEEATWLSPIVVVVKKMENLEFVWISGSLMQLL